MQNLLCGRVCGFLDAPSWPQIGLVGTAKPLTAGQNITLTCSAPVGRPSAIHLTWMRKSPGNLTWLPLQNDSVDVALTTDDVGANDMRLLVSRLKLTLAAADDCVVYRCLATNGDVTVASVNYTLQVQCKKLLCALHVTYF